MVMVTALDSRRWRPRFSLRMFLLVLTVLSIWLGWCITRVRDRQAALAAVYAAGGYTNSFPPAFRHELPFTLWLFGARRVDSLHISSKLYTDETPGRFRGFAGYQRIEALFPEAEIWIGTKADPSLPNDWPVAMSPRRPPRVKPAASAAAPRQTSRKSSP